MDDEFGDDEPAEGPEDEGDSSEAQEESSEEEEDDGDVASLKEELWSDEDESDQIFKKGVPFFLFL